MVLKVVQKGAVAGRIAIITPDDETANFNGGRVMSGMGLSNVQHIVVLTFSGEACGNPTYDYYHAWTNTGHLVRLPGKESISDAGTFYQAETLTCLTNNHSDIYDDGQYKKVETASANGNISFKGYDVSLGRLIKTKNFK